MRFRIAVLLFLVCLICSVGLAERVSDDWIRLDGCTLIENPYNDGDSFHVRHKGNEYIFRLYFVDCPESDASLPERNGEQAQVFGLAPEAVPAAGVLAKTYTLGLLSDKQFTVYTHWSDARGRSKLKRFYAVILSGEKNLARELVTAGWARAFGEKSNYPDAAHSKRFVEDLKELQDKAKKSGVGAFARVAALAPQENQDPKVTKPAAAESKMTVQKGSSDLLDINTATREQLDTLPDIGLVRADKIIAARPFNSKEDIKRVKGIDEGIFAKIAPLIKAR